MKSIPAETGNTSSRGPRFVRVGAIQYSGRLSAQINLMRSPSILPKRYKQAATGVRRPAEFSSGPTRWKLFALCGALVLVLFIAEQARNPSAWLFFDKLDNQARDLPPDPRVFPKPTRTTHDPLGTFVSSDD